MGSRKSTHPRNSALASVASGVYTKICHKSSCTISCLQLLEPALCLRLDFFERVAVRVIRRQLKHLMLFCA